MNLIDQLILNSLNDSIIDENFNDTFVILKMHALNAVNDGHDLDRSQDQLSFLFSYFRNVEKRAYYTTTYNSRALIVSLKSGVIGVTIFFNHFYKTCEVVSHKVCLDEGFMGHPIGQDVNILKDINTKRQYLYNDKGEFLSIEAEEIQLTMDSFRSEYYKNFLVTKENGKFNIYSDNLELLILEADGYEIVGDWYCVSRKGSCLYLSHVAKGNLILEGFEQIEYFTDMYYLHNDLHYFILKKAGGYGIFHLKRYMLWNNFDWDDFRAENGFNADLLKIRFYLGMEGVCYYSYRDSFSWLV